MMRTNCSDYAFTCSACLDPLLSDQYTYNLYGGNEDEILVPTAIVFYGNTSASCVGSETTQPPELYFLTDVEDLILKLNFYVTTDYRLKALSHVPNSEAPETSNAYTAESKSIRVELLESSTAHILGDECLDLSSSSSSGEEEDGTSKAALTGRDCVWDNSATSSSTTNSSISDSVYLTLNNVIRAAGIKSLNEENTKFQNVIQTAFSSKSFNQLSCECRIPGLTHTETLETCQNATANYTSHNDVTSYPYRLSGMDLVMNVEWRNTPYCVEGTRYPFAFHCVQTCLHTYTYTLKRKQVRLPYKTSNVHSSIVSENHLRILQRILQQELLYET